MKLLTGLLRLVPDPACKDFRRFGDGKGAYVNVVAWAESAELFEQRVTAIAQEQLDCIVREMEKVELLESTLQREGCPDEFFTMRTTAERQPDDVVFGVFMAGRKMMRIECDSVPPIVIAKSDFTH
jgi:hypothetical protein